MRVATAVLRWVYGLFYAYVGASWFIHALLGKPWVTPPEPPQAQAITSAFAASGVVDPLIALTCLVGGVLLLRQRTTPLGVAVLAPLVSGIFLFHVFLTGGWVWGTVHFCLLLLLAWLHRGAFRPLWSHGEESRAGSTQTVIPGFLAELEEAFNKAMVSNDVEQISRCMTDDWILVTPESGPVPRSRIVGAIESGVLTHASMSKSSTHCFVVGDVAWVTGRGQSSGVFQGQAIEADEYVTDIYRRVDGQWRCMLTQLTPVADGD